MSKKRPDGNRILNELTDSSAFFKRDQRPVEPPAASPLADPSTTPETTPIRDVTTSRRHDTTTSTPTSTKTNTPAEPKRLDINAPTTSRDSLRLSTEETRALDELRQQLKWDYDLSVSKNDICRAALHALVEEFRAKGERSESLKRLKRKQTSR